jgi:hypothetical protein
MSDADIWIAVHDDGTVEAFDTQDAATNAVRDDTNPWIECVQIQRAPRINDLGAKRRSWVSPPHIVYTGPGGDAA